MNIKQAAAALGILCAALWLVHACSRELEGQSLWLMENARGY